IDNELRYLVNEFNKQTSENELNEEALMWVLNKITSHFCINFFYEWLEVAEEGVVNMRVPRRVSIELMKEMSFPRIAFKYDISKHRIETIECYHSPTKETGCLKPLKCPHGSRSAKRKLHSMMSYPPQRIAMKILDDPSEANIELQRYVDRYVKQFNF